jgi:hypothetical protein
MTVSGRKATIGIAAVATVALALPSLLAQAQDLDGWKNIKWGMTVVQAKAVLGDTASAPEEEYNPNSTMVERILVKGLHIGNLGVSASVYTMQNSEKIVAVTLNASDMHDPPAHRADVFSTLKTLLIQKYGTPKNENRGPDGKGDVEQTVLWTFPSTTLTLTWYETEPRYALGFVRIRYRAVDKDASSVL